MIVKCLVLVLVGCVRDGVVVFGVADSARLCVVEGVTGELQSTPLKPDLH